jgi:WD40 repeat protein
MSDATIVTPLKYRAFISYSHADKDWGDWLHKALERYRIPTKLVGMPTASAGPVPKRLYPIFRDREELPTSADLGGQITAALAASQFLIVIASPRSAKSRWVNEEILAFKRLGREDRILPIIVDGEPNAAGKAGIDPDTECFCPALKFAIGQDGELSDTPFEPICADARPQGDGKPNALLKLVAGLLGVGFDALKQRDAEAARRRRIVQASVGILAAATVVGGGTAIVLQQRYAAQDRAMALAELAVNAANEDDMAAAARYALSGIVLARRAPGGVAAPDAEAVLRRAVAGAMQLQAMESGEPMRQLAVSTDGKWLVTPATGSGAAVWEIATGRRVATLVGQRGRPMVAAFSSDGTRVAVGSLEGEVNVWAIASSEPLARMTGHSGQIAAIAFGRDDTLLTAASDRTARLWDAATGAERAVMRGHRDDILCGALSPDGRIFATGARDATARLWDAATGAALAELSGHGDLISDIAFSPDGSLVATASWDKTARLWESATGVERAVIAGHEDKLTGLAFSPDSRRVVTTSWDATARIWDIAEGRTIQRLEGQDGAVLTARYAPDGQTVVTAGRYDRADLWDAITGVRLKGLVGHGSHIVSLAFAAGGDVIVTASLDGSTRTWRATGQEVPLTLGGHDSGVRKVVWSPDGAVAVTVPSDQGGPVVWDAATGKILRNLTGQESYADAVFAPDGRTLATSGREGVLQVWDTVTWQRRATTPPDRAGITALDIAPDGRRILTGSADGAVTLWDAASLQKLVSLASHEGAIVTAVFSADGTKLLTADPRGAYLWSAEGGERLATFPADREPLEFARLAPDGARLLTVAFGGAATLWDVAAGKALADLRGPGEGNGGGPDILSAAFAPDGSHIAVGDRHGIARIWNAESGQLLATLTGHTNTIEGIAFSPDGKLVATASADRSGRLWDAATGRQLTAVVHPTFVSDIGFSPDGSRYATASQDLTAKLWPILPALREASSALEVRACNEAFAPGVLRLDDHVIAAAVLEPVLDRNPCDPPSFWTRLAYTLGVEGWTTGYYREDPRATRAPAAID